MEKKILNSYLWNSAPNLSYQRKTVDYTYKFIFFVNSLDIYKENKKLFLTYLLQQFCPGHAENQSRNGRLSSIST